MKKMMILGAATVMCCVSAMASGGENKNLFESLWNRLFSDENSVPMESSQNSPHEHQWCVISIDVVNCEYSYIFEVSCGNKFGCPAGGLIPLRADPAMIEAGFPASIIAELEDKIDLDMSSAGCYDGNDHHGQGNGSKLCRVFASTFYVKTTKQCSGCQDFDYEYLPHNYTNLKAKKTPDVTNNCNGPKHQEGGDD